MTIQTITPAPTGPQPSDTYLAGWAEGATDNLTQAISRLPWIWEHLTHDWASGYADAVLDRQAAHLTIAWRLHTTPNGAQS